MNKLHSLAASHATVLKFGESSELRWRKRRSSLAGSKFRAAVERYAATKMPIRGAPPMVEPICFRQSV
jgi:hypothetical protein